MEISGYKTFLGIAIAFLGVIGFGDIITEGEAVVLVDTATQLIGLLIAVYGRIKARKTY